MTLFAKRLNQREKKSNIINLTICNIHEKIWKFEIYYRFMKVHQRYAMHVYNDFVS